MQLLPQLGQKKEVIRVVTHMQLPVQFTQKGYKDRVTAAWCNPLPKHATHERPHGPAHAQRLRIGHLLLYIQGFVVECW